MQENFSFIENHAQGRLPLSMEQTAPTLANRKPFMIMKYAYSIKTSRIKEPDFPYFDKKISCTRELLDFLKSLQSADNEKFIALYMDAQNQLICIQIVNGIVNQAVVYPREIIRHALLVNASAMILAHNHPSGHPKPSDADLRLTKTICETAKFMDILLHDHIIIGGDTGRYYSMREEGVMPS
jgi:DNA repair protein RadC